MHAHTSLLRYFSRIEFRFCITYFIILACFMLLFLVESTPFLRSQEKRYPVCFLQHGCGIYLLLLALYMHNLFFNVDGERRKKVDKKRKSYRQTQSFPFRCVWRYQRNGKDDDGPFNNTNSLYEHYIVFLYDMLYFYVEILFSTKTGHCYNYAVSCNL